MNYVITITVFYEAYWITFLFFGIIFMFVTYNVTGRLWEQDCFNVFIMSGFIIVIFINGGIETKLYHSSSQSCSNNYGTITFPFFNCSFYILKVAYACICCKYGMACGYAHKRASMINYWFWNVFYVLHCLATYVLGCDWYNDRRRHEKNLKDHSC